MPQSVIKFLGPVGSYSHDIAKQFVQQFGLIAPLFTPYSSITTIFHSPIGPDDYIILPLENSTSGDVYETYQALYHRQLHVCTILTLPIQHALIGLHHATLADVKNVYSHPQALLQVTDFITQHQLQTTPYFSTSESVKYISHQNDPTLAAIASKTIIDYYPNTHIIESQINNDQINYTRFLILQRVQPTNQPYTIHFAPVPHGASSHLFLLFEFHNDTAGQLMQVLALLAHYQINLTNIKSRSIAGKKFQYFFIIEGQIAPTFSHQDHHQLLDALLPITNSFSYNVY